VREKRHGQVVNRAELIEELYGVEYLAADTLRLEPHWTVVLLAALVWSGDLVLAIPGQKFDAADLSKLAATPIDELVRFKHVERPKEWNLPSLRALFELLGLTPGMAALVTQGKDQPVQELQKAVSRTVERLVVTRSAVEGGIPFWGRNLIDKEEAKRQGAVLQRTKSFLESLQAYTSPGRLKNFRHDIQEVSDHKVGLEALAEMESLQRLVSELSPTAAFLSEARATLPPSHNWIGRMDGIRDEALVEMTNPARRGAASFRRQFPHKMNDLRKTFVDVYLDLHAKARLGVNADRKKTALKRDQRLARLSALSAIDLMPVWRLQDLQDRLASLESCFALTREELDTAPVCPHCGFRPHLEKEADPANEVLAQLDDRFGELLEDWTQTLLANLNDPVTRENLSLLQPERRNRVDAFIRSRRLPDPLEAEFVDALREVLSGLVKLVVTTRDLRVALLAGGSPASPAEMKARFERYLDGLAKKQDPAKIRVVLE